MPKILPLSAPSEAIYGAVVRCNGFLFKGAQNIAPVSTSVLSETGFDI